MFSSTKDEKNSAQKETMASEGGHTFDDAKRAARMAKDDIRDGVHTLGNNIEGMARDSGHKMRDMADSVGHNLNEASRNVGIRIRDNPVQSSFIALGIGILVGILFQRR